MEKNGYFIVSTREDGTFITVMPPENGGRSVKVDDLLYYFNEKKFSSYDAIDISTGMARVTINNTFKASSERIYSSGPFCAYRIDDDKMVMRAVMFPAVNNEGAMTVDEIMGDLRARSITFGIDEALIEEVVKNKIYNTEFIIAQGEMPVQGHDAEIKYCFSTEHRAKPKMNDDGTVDYHELDLISRVEAEGVVAELIPEDKGIPGHNIMGMEIAPNRVSKKNFKYGKNLYISEDGLKLISKVSGHVTLENDKVFVSNTYEVPVDLDNTTGDVNYDGNVIVRGNVRAGFSLKATGDVTIIGVVEGAYINAGGNVTINRGVQGMNKAEIHAGGNIVAKFIENATVVCGGDLETDSLLHSSASAGGEIRAAGKNGLIVGGTARARKNVVAKQIGNTMGTVTNIYVGVDPALRKRVNELSQAIVKANEDKDKLNKLIAGLRKKMEVEGGLDAQKQEMLQKSMKNIILLEQGIKRDSAELKDGQEKLVEDKDVRVKISRSIYQGVKLSFGSTVFYIKDRNDYCQYAKQGADVVRLAL